MFPVFFGACFENTDAKNHYEHLNFKVMRSFIEDYLQNPSLAVAAAQNTPMGWTEDIDEDMIYSQLASPEFRLYEEIILNASSGDAVQDYMKNHIFVG